MVGKRPSSTALISRVSSQTEYTLGPPARFPKRSNWPAEVAGLGGRRSGIVALLCGLAFELVEPTFRLLRRFVRGGQRLDHETQPPARFRGLRLPGHVAAQGDVVHALLQPPERVAGSLVGRIRLGGGAQVGGGLWKLVVGLQRGGGEQVLRRERFAHLGAGAALS